MNIENCTAYIVGKYQDDGSDTLDGAKKGDIYIVMENTPENMALAKKLLTNN